MSALLLARELGLSRAFGLCFGSAPLPLLDRDLSVIVGAAEVEGKLVAVCSTPSAASTSSIGAAGKPEAEADVGAGIFSARFRLMQWGKSSSSDMPQDNSRKFHDLFEPQHAKQSEDQLRIRLWLQAELTENLPINMPGAPPHRSSVEPPAAADRARRLRGDF